MYRFPPFIPPAGAAPEPPNNSPSSRFFHETPTGPINGDQERFLTFLMLFYSRLIFFSFLGVAFYLLLTPLGVDFAATRWHFRPQTP